MHKIIRAYSPTTSQKMIKIFFLLSAFMFAFYPSTIFADKVKNMQGAFYWDKHAYPEGWEVTQNPTSMLYGYHGYHKMGDMPSLRFFVDFVGGTKNDIQNLDERSKDYRKIISGVHFKKGPGLDLTPKREDRIKVRLYAYEFETQEKLDSYFKLISKTTRDVIVPLSVRNQKRMMDAKTSLDQDRKRIGIGRWKHCYCPSFQSESFAHNFHVKHESIPFGDQSLVLPSNSKIFNKITYTYKCKNNNLKVTSIDAKGDGTEYWTHSLYFVSRANWLLMAFVDLGPDYQPQPVTTDCSTSIKSPKPPPEAKILEVIREAYEKMSHHAGFPANLPPASSPNQIDKPEPGILYYIDKECK